MIEGNRTTGRVRILRTGVLVAVLSVVASGCWLTYGSDASNTRAAALETTISPANVDELEELWRVPGTDGSTSTPAVFGGVVYFGNWDGTLRAVSAADGTAIWTRQLTNTVIDDSPLLHANRVYVGDGAGNLHAVDSATGVPVWSRDLDPHPNTRIFSSPIAVDDMIIVGVASVELAIQKPDYTFRGSIVALDEATGTERWRVYTTANNAQQGAGVSVWSSAAVDSGRGLLYIGTGQTYEPPASPRGDALMAIEYATGAVRWVRQFTAGDVYTIFGHRPRVPTPTSARRRTCSASATGTSSGSATRRVSTRSSTATTGSDVWARQLPTGSHLGGIMTTAAYNAGRIYLASNQWSNLVNFHDPNNRSTTFALDAATGATLWQRSLPSATFGAMTYANGVVYQPTITGTVYALNAATGAILWSDTPGADLGGGISVSGGQVFVPYGFWFFAAPANPNGGIVAYGLPEGSAQQRSGAGA